MFTDFARVWTPLAPSSAIKKDPSRHVLAGTPLVLWRDRTDTPVALLDRCPHRSVSLALGKRTDCGDLACGFHGWEFGAGGACTHVPFNPDAPRQRLGAVSFPVRERGGLVWVFTGFDPTDEPAYPESLDDPSLARMDHVEEWDAHWTRAMENMLDYPHLPYVHATTIGRFVRKKARRDSRLSYDLEDTNWGFRFGTRLDGYPPAAWLRWYRPNSMTLDVAPAPRMMRIQIYCIPAEPDRVRMMLVTTRNFAPNPVASVPFDRLNIHVLHQDRRIVESSDPIEVPEANLEKSVPTDRPTLTFRTWYLRQLKGTCVDLVPRTGATTPN